MLFKQFDINANDVIIDGVALERPSYLSAGQWIAFWEACERCQDGEDWQEGFEAGQEDAKESIHDLEEEVSRLEGELIDAKAWVDADRKEEYRRGHADGVIAGRLDSSL